MGGFYHGSVNSDAYVILAGGGYKSVSDFLTGQDHYKTSPGAGTAGTSSATSGSTLSVPYVTVNANGHVTGYGTHTHTVTGFAAEHSHPYLPTAGGTMTGAINFTNTNARIAFGSLATSPITSYKAPSLGTNGVGIYSRYGNSSDEGAIIITEDTCVVYNSADTGWNFQVLDKDLGTDMTNDATRSFGVAQDHKVYSLGGYVKNGSSDSYVLLGGGGHKALSDFLTSLPSHNHDGRYLQYNGWWTDGNGSNVNNANGMIFSYQSHGNPHGWGILTTFDYQYNSSYKMQLFSDGYNNGWTYYRNRSSDRGGWNAWVRLADGTNSSVSGGGASWGSSITVKILDTTCTLTIPSNPNTNTWRKVQLNGTDKLGTGTNTNPLNIKAGTGISITESGGTFTFNCTVSGSSDVYWKDVKDKIRGGNEFNIVPSGYNSTMWFNYQSDANTTVTVSEYIFGNGSHSASAAIKSGTVYPGSNASYDIGKTGSRWAWGYFNSGILIGGTSYTGPHTNAAGTTVASGYIEMNATDPYIDFHRSGYYTSDYSSRLVHWNNRDRLYYECYSSTYSGYVATCEGNANNLVIIGVFDLYRTNDTTTTWSLSNICGPCSFSLLKSDSVYDVSFKSNTGYVQSWTISSNILRVYVNAPSSSTYAWKSTPYAVSCDARVMTRWINKQPVVTNCLHGDWVGSSVECLCTNLSNGSSLYYYSNSPGRYIYITGSRPWGYDDGDNGLGMDMMRNTGDLSYQRIRFTVFGYIS